MKPLPKAFREANRYIIFRIHSEQPIRFSQFESTCFQTLTQCIGSFHLPQLDVSLVKDKFNPPYGVIKTNAKGVKEVRLALACIDKIDDQVVRIEPILTTSQLRKVKEICKH